MRTIGSDYQTCPLSVNQDSIFTISEFGESRPSLIGIGSKPWNLEGT
jgi:hypothetical protein